MDLAVDPERLAFGLKGRAGRCPTAASAVSGSFLTETGVVGSGFGGHGGRGGWTGDPAGAVMATRWAAGERHLEVGV